EKLRRLADIRQNWVDLSPYIRVVLPEFVRVASLPFGVTYRFAQRAMHFVANCIPFLKISRGVPCDKPVIPLASQRSRLLSRERDAFALALGPDCFDASSDLSIPLAKLLLRDVRPVTRRRGELRLVGGLVLPAVLPAHIIGKAFASEVFAGAVLP